MVPRQERALNRLLHRQLHDAATKEKRGGNRKTAGTEGKTPAEIDPKTGAAPRLALTDTPSGPDPPRPNPKRDRKTEIKRSIAQVPENPKSKTPICWDAACHIGCLRPPMQKLDYSVAMQVLRRGGLKNGPKINLKDVDGRVAQLRAQHKAEVADKAAEGKAKAKAKAKGKAGWLVPDDYSGKVTSMEQDLGELALGPDFGWHDAFRAAQFVDTRPLAGDEPSKRTACYEALKDGGYLRSHVASHLVNARLLGDMSLSVEDILRNAVDHGHPHSLNKHILP